MKNSILNEVQFNKKIEQIYKEEQIKILQEKWDKLTGKEKTFVIEFLKHVNPKKSHLVKESWYNTLLDVVGIFDPTGAFDVINGLSYWNQGDKLFAILSWVSAIPALGDLIAKPVIAAMKVGGRGTKAFKAAVVAGDASKIASTASASGGIIKKFVQSSPTWGGKLLNALKAAIGKFPGLGKPLVRAIEEYILIFSRAGKEISLPSKVMKGGKLVSVEKALTSLEKEELLKQLSKDQFKAFSKYGDYKNSYLKYMTSDTPFFQKIYAGVPRIFGGNPATRSLMRRTKWYLGLLDWLGIGNAVGPEELENMVPDLEKKVEEYHQTPQAQQNFAEDFAQSGGQQQNASSSPPPPAPTQTKQDDPFSFINTLIGAGRTATALL